MADPSDDQERPTMERRPGPPSTLDELRERLITAGMHALLTNGVAIGLDAVRVADAIEATGAARATAYRALADDELDPQARLRKEVLLRVLERDSRAHNVDVVTGAFAAEYVRLADRAASDDIAERTAAFRSMLRVGGAAAYQNVASSRERAILTAAYGSESSQDPDPDGWRHNALAAGEHLVTRQFAEFYAANMELFGNRLRPGLTLDQFSVAAAALLEGLAMRDRFRDDLDGIVLSTGPDGDDEVWTLYAAALEGLVWAFFEPDPDNPAAVDVTLR
jgi:hypothetical protein